MLYWAPVPGGGPFQEIRNCLPQVRGAPVANTKQFRVNEGSAGQQRVRDVANEPFCERHGPRQGMTHKPARKYEPVKTECLARGQGPHKLRTKGFTQQPAMAGCWVNPLVRNLCGPWPRARHSVLTGSYLRAGLCVIPCLGPCRSQNGSLATSRTRCCPALPSFTRNCFVFATGAPRTCGRQLRISWKGPPPGTGAQ